MAFPPAAPLPTAAAAPPPGAAVAPILRFVERVGNAPGGALCERDIIDAGHRSCDMYDGGLGDSSRRPGVGVAALAAA
ncbi:hypothetical protein BDV32DRAFT_129964 [Aspergillus pseudonomiae]|uniref:Uncharacterized protein n=1 Tax=Aspergillus pseudonomiae TaxID=1506151 RepID=A0A5N7DGE8_9EURO|nr:uncharacterized protein BDV37DRAFT_245455 [Aspergillus pseudonomiae]KAB8255955.1 hypothetical protein BDV32DRAFT_129964 [Aspergillus pseudonomiae]KAE8405289.1 hypothetical protein BDV37DRAFT_245455 [Aspergillus pseudonomiae]